MKKKKYYLLLLIFIVMLTSGCFINKKKLEGTDADYLESYYIITKDENNGKIRYYEVNGKGNERKAEEFESDIFDDVIDVNKYTCFYNYHDEERHGFFNKYVDSCKMISSNGNDVSDDPLYKKIAIQIASLEYDMFYPKIYRVGEEFYVTRLKNVNLSSPYDLYKYNVATDKLELICEMINEEIIGFKKKSIN